MQNLHDFVVHQPDVSVLIPVQHSTAVERGARRPLTDVAIKNAKPREKSYRLHDSGGLYLEVFPNGSKLWRWKYRFQGKEKRLALGAYRRAGPVMLLRPQPRPGSRHREIPAPFAVHPETAQPTGQVQYLATTEWSLNEVKRPQTPLPTPSPFVVSMQVHNKATSLKGQV
ncbi:hypothetical protein QFZ98_008112 [Paraburkholderia youngii]